MLILSCASLSLLYFSLCPVSLSWLMMVSSLSLALLRVGPGLSGAFLMLARSGWRWLSALARSGRFGDAAA